MDNKNWVYLGSPAKIIFKKEYRYIRCILKYPFQVAFSSDILLCDTSVYYIAATIQIKEILTSGRFVWPIMLLWIEIMHSMRSLCFAISAEQHKTKQYKIKFKKTQNYFTGIIRATFRNNSKIRRKHFLQGYTASRINKNPKTKGITMLNTIGN